MLTFVFKKYWGDIFTYVFAKTWNMPARMHKKLVIAIASGKGTKLTGDQGCQGDLFFTEYVCII